MILVSPIDNIEVLQMQAWERYEDAREVVQLLANDIGLAAVVSEKREFEGEVEDWEIDVAGYDVSGKLVVFECRKRSRKVEKGHVAHFAYVVKDLGAMGFVVSQKGLSSGAQNIADHHAIQHITLEWNQETGQKVIEFMGRFFATAGLGLFLCGALPDELEKPVS
jgi:hypothetical protein